MNIEHEIEKRARKIIKVKRRLFVIRSISVHKHINATLDGLDKEITDIEEEIEMLIRKDQEMNENFELVTGIIGIGPVIATDLIIKTGNFRIIDTHRRAASYAGVCPFPNASGKMVKKSRTSPFADKKLKSLLINNPLLSHRIYLILTPYLSL